MRLFERSENTRLAWLQYNGGYTPYLTVLNAETQLFPAELAYSQGKTALLAAFVNIYQAMGGGWVNKADELTQAQTSPGR
jgi:outer membrane protein, multidrug efflux system